MNILEALNQRSSSSCELCKSTTELSVYQVPPAESDSVDHCILICATCSSDLKSTSELNIHHWHCLNDSMWSTVPAVQIVAWRMLKRLSSESWAQDLFDMLYLDDELLQWAESDSQGQTDESSSNSPTKDSNGTILEAGDTVTIIKDLNVKGANFTAKRGTAVRNISLTDNPEHIEGRVNGTRIVLLTCYLKKSN